MYIHFMHGNCCACPKPGPGIVDNHSSIFLFMTSRSYIQIGFVDHLTFTRGYCWSADISCRPLTARIKSQMGVQAPITTWRVTVSWKVEQRFINLIGISHHVNTSKFDYIESDIIFTWYSIIYIVWSSPKKPLTHTIAYFVKYWADTIWYCDMKNNKL